jgi:TonB family protein
MVSMAETIASPYLGRQNSLTKWPPMKLLVVIVAIAPLVARAQSKLTRFEFRGRALGDSISQPADPGHCSERDVRQQVTCYEFGVPIGEAIVDVTYDYLNGRLFSVALSYPPDHFAELTRVLVARFGAPITRSERFATVGGIRAQNPIYAWRFREGQFEVKRYGSSLSEGFGSIATVKGVMGWSRLRDIAAREAALRDVATPPPSRRSTEPGPEFVAQANADQPYFEYQVGKPVQTAPGSSSPRYPDMLKSANVEGEVLAQFVVDTMGRAEMGTLKVLKSSHDGFTQAVKNALPDMRFTPAEISGHKVMQMVQMPFTFAQTR